jgi:hypothetical protein
MPANRSELPVAHIHAPRFPHDPIEIVGNKPGLERLINVLIDAIGSREAKDTIYSCDRKGAEVRATCLQGRRRPEEWARAGSPHWDVDDPLVARIMELTEENGRLRRVVTMLRHLSKSIKPVDPHGTTEGNDKTAINQE